MANENVEDAQFSIENISIRQLTINVKKNIDIL